MPPIGRYIYIYMRYILYTLPPSNVASWEIPDKQRFFGQNPRRTASPKETSVGQAVDHSDMVRGCARLLNVQLHMSCSCHVVSVYDTNIGYVMVRTVRHECVVCANSVVYIYVHLCSVCMQVCVCLAVRLSACLPVCLYVRSMYIYI